LEPAVPSSSDAAGLLAQLERIAQDVGATALQARHSYSPAPTVQVTTGAGPQASDTAGDGPATVEAVPASIAMPNQLVTVSLAISGSYGQVSNFISKAESSLRLNSIVK